MKAIIATWQRRLMVAIFVMLLAAFALYATMALPSNVSAGNLSAGDLMKRMVLVPGLLAVLVFVF
jgi:hypothetical protein